MSAAAKAAKENGSSREFQRLPTLQQLRLFMTGPCCWTMSGDNCPFTCWS